MMNARKMVAIAPVTIQPEPSRERTREKMNNSVTPIIAGEGRRLLEGVNLPEKCQLKLVESKTFKSGGVALRYLKQ